MSEGLVALLQIAGVAIAAAAGAYLERLSARRGAAFRLWRRAAESCGLTHVGWSASRIGKDSHLEGRWNGLSVRLEHSRRHKGVRTLVVIGLADAASGVTLRRATRVDGVVGGSETEAGDDTFDRQVFVQGPRPILRAALDAALREDVLRLLRGQLAHRGAGALDVDAAVLNGELRADVVEREEDGLSSLPELLAALLDIARRLSPEDVPARLAHNARHDPLEAVRLNNLVTLEREHGDHPGTADVLRACCADSSGEVRLYAAAALGGEGRGVLLEIAAGADVDRAVRAVDALGRDLARDRGSARLPVEPLGRLLQRDAPAVAAAAALALGRTALPSAEPLLIRALEGAPEVRRAAAEALTSVGTAAAVLALQELADRDGGSTRRTALNAITEIQARISGAAPGQVSLAGSDAGLVTLADPVEGQVSLADFPGPATRPDDPR